MTPARYAWPRRLDPGWKTARLRSCPTSSIQDRLPVIHPQII